MSTSGIVRTPHFGTIPVHRRDCPLCDQSNSAEARSRYSRGTWNLKKCRQCGFVYINSAPHYELQFEKMAWETTSKLEERRRTRSHPILYELSKRTRSRMNVLPKRTVARYVTAYIKGGNILDLGCGDGAKMMTLPDSFLPFGIDISSSAAAKADSAFRPRGGYAINAPCVVGLRHFPDNFFAAASLRSYLEHETDPLPVLKELWRVLAPGSIAIVKVPNYASVNRRIMGARWCGFRFPDHLNYFTPKTLRAMAMRAGLKIRFGLTDRLPTSDNMWAVLTKVGS